MMTLLNPTVPEAVKRTFTLTGPEGIFSMDTAQQAGAALGGFWFAKLFTALVRGYVPATENKMLATGIGVLIPLVGGRLLGKYVDGKTGAAIETGSYVAAFSSVVAALIRDNFGAQLPPVVNEALGAPYYQRSGMGNIWSKGDVGDSFSAMPVLGTGYELESKKLGAEPDQYNTQALAADNDIQVFGY